MRPYPLAFMLAAWLSCTALAGAKGTVTVQQVDGSVQSYPNSSIRVVNKTLQLVSPDGKGTLVIKDAACSYVEQLLRCLPYTAVLTQKGNHPIPIAQGAIYFNTTNQKQQLKYSSTQVGANSVYGLVKTVHGTYVTIIGALDGGAK